ncbi:MAG: pilus assembly FimT family protein [Patescibacteria group bacterium]|jgi:prepilin-type N-terminal cleavage/methylation domain-containing protein
MSLPLKSGFSLIELLVVMTIIGTLTGLGMMAFSEIQEDQLLKKTVKQVRSGLYEARESAFFGKKPNPGCTPFNGVEFAYSTTSFSLHPHCNNIQQSATKTVSLDKGVQLTSSGSVLFSSVTRGADAEESIMIQIPGTTKDATITVTQTGEITVTY